MMMSYLPLKMLFRRYYISAAYDRYFASGNRHLRRIHRVVAAPSSRLGVTRWPLFYRRRTSRHNVRIEWRSRALEITLAVHYTDRREVACHIV
jgi:hypothetical protein